MPWPCVLLSNAFKCFPMLSKVVPGVMSAVSDAVLRRLATDRPSLLSGVLLGLTPEGRTLGHPGFGLSVASFAEQTETVEIHSPELAVARTAVLDYFQSPDQARLEKVLNQARLEKVLNQARLEKVLDQTRLEKVLDQARLEKDKTADETTSSGML